MSMTLAAGLIVTACGAAWGAPPDEIRQLAREVVTQVAINSDEEFFDAWNLDWPGLEAVKAAVEAQDYQAAKVALKQYMLQRRQPRWHINHWQMPATPQGAPETHSLYAMAERTLNHHFIVDGFEVQLGEKIDWNYLPLKQPDGKPDMEYPLIHWVNRFYHVVYLGRLYWYSRDERYAREFASQIVDHVLSNPAPEEYL